MKIGTKKNKWKRGFTVIELMIVVALFSIITSAILATFVAMVKQSELVNARIKMRNESRLGTDYMISNIRMAKLNNDQGNNDTFPNIQYEDADGNLQPWPPPALGGGSPFSEPVNSITFHRPVDNGSGSPFVEDTANVNWSVPITFRLDTDDVNDDQRTNQVVQLNDGEFVRVIIDDISPVVNSGNNSIYDTPATGGLAFQAAVGALEDVTRIFITVIQRRELSNVAGQNNEIVQRYDTYVNIQN